MRRLGSRGVASARSALLSVVLGLTACNAPAPVPETPLPLAWQAQVSDAISRPAVADGAIFLVDDRSKLIALDAETGAKRWEADLEQSGHRDEPIGVDVGRVYVAVQGDAGKVLAFDAATGARQWEVAFGPYRDDEHPLAHADVTYFEAPASDGMSAALRAVDGDTGAMLWEFPIGSYVATSPIAGDGLIYVGAYQFSGPSNKARRVYAIDATTGQERWNYPSDLDLSGRFALDEDRLYIGADGGVVIARQAATGGPAWTARVGGRLSNSPAVADGLVYIGTTDRDMVALDAEDGVERWRLAVDSAVLTQATVADGVVYFGTNGGYLYAVDAVTGLEQWKVQSPLRKPFAAPEYVPAMATTPVVAGDLLLYYNGHTLNALKLR